MKINHECNADYVFTRMVCETIIIPATSSQEAEEKLDEMLENDYVRGRSELAPMDEFTYQCII